MSDITETEAPDPRFKTVTMMLRDERNRRLRETDHWASRQTKYDASPDRL